MMKEGEMKKFRIEMNGCSWNCETAAILCRREAVKSFFRKITVGQKWRWRAEL